MKNSPNNAQWQTCPTGLLQSLAPAQRPPQMLGSFSKGVLLGIVVAIALFGYSWSRNSDQAPAGNLYCHQVIGYLESYKSNELPVEIRDRVDVHLASCDECRQAFEAHSVANVDSQKRSNHILVAAAKK